MKAIIALLVLGILMAGCAQQFANSIVTSPNAPNQTSAGAANATVHIKNFAFNPANLTINKGETVVWINDDSAPHLVKFPDFQSGTLGTGDSYEHTFGTQGEFEYACGIHPSMRGKVIVK
jgi:plastocyanin